MKAIYVEPTNFCNQSCEYCFQNNGAMTREKGFMSLQTYTTLLKQIEPTTLILHHSGEPLLHENIGALIRYGKKAGHTIEMTTNGSLLHKKAKDIIGAGIDGVTVSLGQGVKKKDLDALFRYNKNAHITFTCVEGIEPEEYGHHPDTFIWRKRMDWHGTVGKTENAIRHWGKRLFVRPLCKTLDTAPAVLWDGTVVPCCLDYNANINLGNINKRKFNDILADADWLRDILRSPEKTMNHPVCGKCAL